jgi:hypothetical protein
MESDARESSADDDWRLEAELDLSDGGRALRGLIARLRDPEVVRDVEAAVAPEVVITHDGRLLFAYAPDESSLKAARGAIEEVLQRDGVRASVRLSHWDRRRDRWQQTDPPPSAQETTLQQAQDDDADAIETRTMVAHSGKLIRAEFEQTMLAWAQKLGLECKIIEHPHLLSTQVGFTVTGPKGRIDEFAQGLNAEGWATVRTETGVMLSPL